jgi:protein phosphatase
VRFVKKWRSAVRIVVPKFCLVVLIGPSGCGKSTFARKHFIKTEVVSSDFCRGIICDDENNQLISAHAFDLLHYIVEKRLIIGRLTVVDATNVQEKARRELIKIANRNNCLAAAITFNVSEDICRERDDCRADRHVGVKVIKNHTELLKKSIRSLYNEGFKYVYILNSQEEIDDAKIIREG